MIGGHFEGSLTERKIHRGTGKGSAKGGQSRMTIDKLPDVALLGIFDFYVNETGSSWHALVHVCQKWRIVVFGSPRRLGLKLRCRASTPVRETLDVWPLLPIAIKTNPDDRWADREKWPLKKWGVDYIIAALEHNDRICQLELYYFQNSHFEKVLAEMQRPFPALTVLRLWPDDKTSRLVPIPASFLGGSAPHLQTLHLDRVPFPGLPKLLLSAAHLVNLSLGGIPRSGYISPEAMLTCLSVLTRLESLSIGFKSTRSFLRQRSQYLPLPTRILLPTLSNLWFEGVGDYLENLVARIDAPLLDSLDVTIFNQMFDTPQLTQLISRTPKFKAYNHTQLFFSETESWIILSQAFNRGFELRIAYSSQPDEQTSTLVQTLSSSFPQALIAAAEHLYVLVCGSYEEDVETSQWLELLLPFAGVKALYISLEFILSLPRALDELSWESLEEIEVLPALQVVFLEGSELFPHPPGVQDVIGQIVAARLLSCQPITVSPWDIDDETEET